MNNYYNIQSAIEQARKPHTITVSRNSVFTYRDLYEMILSIYWEQLEKAASNTTRDLCKSLISTHMCAVSYDLIGGIY